MAARDGKECNPLASLASIGRTWAIVLAGGEGRRLHSLTTTVLGIAVPKQFCSLRGGCSLLLDAVKRAEAVASRDHIVTDVSQDHQCWWKPVLSAVPDGNIVVQPANRGTANGILLPLLYIATRDPEACIVLLPSDHHVRDERALASALQSAVNALAARREQILLIGTPPEEADPDLGYIVPGAREGAVWTVTRFVEKPDLRLAEDLVAGGALWNTFIVIARAAALLDLFTEKYPDIVTRMRSAIMKGPCSSGSSPATTALYQELHDIDFSRHILQGAEARLRVVRASRCGWNDLGTPKRLAKTLRSLPESCESFGDTTGIPSGFLNLAAQHARLQASGISNPEHLSTV
jgi:mannose-1-phosphate guanylyltransferase